MEGRGHGPISSTTRHLRRGTGEHQGGNVKMYDPFPRFEPRVP